MPDTIAQRYIKIYERECSKDQNFKTNLWQPTADLIHPRMNQITKLTEPGQNKTEDIFNTTGMLAAEDAASALTQMMIPPGQEFFSVSIEGKSNLSSKGKRYLDFLSQRSHELIFASNYIPQYNEAIQSFLVFGPCNLFTEWDVSENAINYLNFDVGTYTIVRNSRGKIVAVMVMWRIMAAEAAEVFGDMAGTNVTAASASDVKKYETFEYLHVVEPRDSFNPELNRMALHMPWRSLWINIKDKVISKEGGYLHNPYSISGWRRAQSEKWARGRGTMALPAVRQIQQMEIDVTESGNKHVNPPMEVLDSFDGNVDVRPGAENRVQEKNTINRLGVEGNFPYGIDQLERKGDEIKDIFLMKIFRQFIELTGDRRTTQEIIERKNQAIRLVGAPIMNAYSDLMTPSITRSILLFIRHGKIIFEGSPNPPAELAGLKWGLEFQGELALAMRDHQSRGFMQWSNFLGNIGSVFPNEHIEDYIAFDRAIPRIGRSFGVNVEDSATEEEVQAKKEKRANQQAQIQQMQAVAASADAYKNTTKKPEDGSAAKMVQDQLGA